MLIQLKWIPFELEIHTPQPRLLTVLYISPISARQLPLPAVPVNLIFISQVGIAPRIGKLVNAVAGYTGVGVVMEYNVPDDGTITAATPELSDVYENDPELSDVGAVSENDTSANRYAPDFGPSVNVPKVGSNSFTVSVVLTLALR